MLSIIACVISFFTLVFTAAIFFRLCRICDKLRCSGKYDDENAHVVPFDFPEKKE